MDHGRNITEQAAGTSPGMNTITDNVGRRPVMNWQLVSTFR